MTREDRRRRKRPPKTSDPVVDALQLAKQHLADADLAIDTALEAYGGTTPEPPEPPDGDTIPVGPGDDLLAMVNSGPAGAVYAIDPAFYGALGDSKIKVSCTLQSTAPLPDRRVDLSLVGPTLTGALLVEAPNVTFRGLRLEGIGMTMIQAGDGTTVDRCVITGPSNGGTQQRGIMANAADVTVMRCHISGIFKTEDTQAVGCNRKTKRLRVLDCYLEASGENFMSGGDDPDVAEDVPTDILLEDCTFYKPPEWMTKAECTCKNLFELKNVKGCVVRRCTFENCWAHGQTGNAIVLTVRNQSGGAPFSTIEDVLIEDITIKHVGGGFQILGRDYTHPSQVMRNLTIRRVTIEDMSKTWQRGDALASGRAFSISGGPNGVILEDIDACIAPGDLTAAIGFDQLEYPVEGLEIRRCKMHEGDYGITGADTTKPIGVDQINSACPNGYTWEDVTIQKGDSGRKITYPPDTTLLPPAATRTPRDPEGRDTATPTREQLRARRVGFFFDRDHERDVEGP